MLLIVAKLARYSNIFKRNLNEKLYFRGVIQTIPYVLKVTLQKTPIDVNQMGVFVYICVLVCINLNVCDCLTITIRQFFYICR